MENSSLLEQWKDRKKTLSSPKAIGKAPEGVPIPLSHGQKRLWFLQQVYPENPFYNYSELYRFTGDVQMDVLLRALNLVFQNHDILRTVYASEDGKPYMTTVSEPVLSISEHDLRTSEESKETALQRIWDAEAGHNFDLSEPPVALVSVIRTADDEYRVMLTLHHIATDKWSMNLLRSEWAFYYRSLSRDIFPEIRRPEVQYADFAHWQRNRVIKWEQVDYWRGKLSGDIPIIDLPTDFSRPKRPNFKGRSSEIRHFSPADSEAILRCCKEMGVTPYVFFLSIYYLFLYRYARQNDILIGSPISNRDHKSLEDTIGFFNDTIVLRTEIEPKARFVDLINAVKKTTLEAFSNKDVPFDFLVRELQQQRSLSVNPFFQVMFLYYSVSEPEFFGKEVQVDYEFYNPGVSKFDLTFDVAEEKGRLSYAFEYSSELFRPETIARFQDHIGLLINGVVAAPEKGISEIGMFSDDEKKFLLPQKGKGTDTFGEFTGIHQAIEHIAATRPDATAVTFFDSSLTYGELDAKAHALATHILKKIGRGDVGTDGSVTKTTPSTTKTPKRDSKTPEPDDTADESDKIAKKNGTATENNNPIIGLCVERSLEMAVGLLAILKAGCAYVPIDPKYPIHRVDYMLGDADIKLLVTQRKLAPLFEKSKTDRLFVDDTETSHQKEIHPVKMPVPKEDDLAYVIYTSGSTGRPKGVPITHKNILNSTAGRLDFYPENPQAFLLLSSISFDSSKAGIFWTLCTGGNLVISEDRMEQDIIKLGNTIRKHRVTHMLLLPTLYQLMLEHAETEKLESLTTVMVAGEACSPSLTDIHFSTLPDTALYNEYGPTEASVWSIAHKVGPNASGSQVPLGRPVANSEIYLLDSDLNLVPFGATGEIYIGGAGLSNGYLDRPDLTAEAFVDNPFDAGRGETLYKTGDLARYNADGDIVFLGRSDQQVKIRGYRVELQEIEKAIRSVSNTDQVVVLAEGEGAVPKRIAAYLTSKYPIGIGDLKKSLKNRLPAYMVPVSMAQIDAMPLLPNGKIDTSALQGLKVTGESDEGSEKQPPTNETEQSLHSIWKEILKLEDIGIHDDFFELGGDSILSIQFIAKARKAGIHLTPNQIFENRTIASLAQYIASKENPVEEWDYLVPLRKEGSENPLFCIHAGGGHVFFYTILTKYIGGHRPIYALQASGVYADIDMHHSIEAMARDYLQAIRSVQPTGPYNIMVYCFSVAVGHEIQIQLRELGETANLIVMDTMTDPWKLDTGNRLRMRIKSFAKRLFSSPIKTVQVMIRERMIQLRIKLRKKMAQGDDRALARMNDNLARICSRYQWHPHREKVTLLLTEKPDEEINKEVVGSWKKVALGGITVVPIKGDHIDLFAEPQVAVVAEKIEENCV